MGLNIGSSKTRDILLGSSSLVEKVYLGSTQVYEVDDKNILDIQIANTSMYKMETDGNLRGRPACANKTDWGDGTVDTSTAHTYSSAGTMK